VIEDWQSWGTIDGTAPPELNWRANGYLFIVGPDDVDTLADNFETHQKCGVQAEWLEKADLTQRYPGLETDDLVAGILSPRDGWLNPKVFFSILRAKAQAAGVTFLTDRVTSLDKAGTAVRVVGLASGRTVAVEAVVNAAGVDTPDLADLVGMTIPVEPMRRHEHYLETEYDANHLPFVKDVHGLAVHAHRDGVSVGKVDFDHAGGEDFTIDATDFTDRVAPAMAERFAGLGRLTLRDFWTGLYDQNRFDGNVILGNWPGHLDNFYVACGFSGHGLMHALAVGRGLTELITQGMYQSLDLSPMGYQRIIDKQPYGEEGVR
jgi:FAD-dependent oxidoreductase domain-containing protein 1